MRLDGGEKMISSDVVSQFTQVLIGEALKVIALCLTQDETLADHTNIPAHNICRLMEMCLHSMYFQFQDILNEQIDEQRWIHPYHR